MSFRHPTDELINFLMRLNCVSFYCLSLFSILACSFLLILSSFASDNSVSESDDYNRTDMQNSSINIETTQIPGGMMFRFARNGEPLSYKEALKVMSGLEEFSFLLRKTILSTDFEAVFWELPPITRETNPQFQFVVLNAPHLASISEDDQTFASHFEQDCSVVNFKNLGGKSTLVSPCPKITATKHEHLAAFLRTATDEQAYELFEVVAVEVERWLERSEEPVWVSTEGSGVYWLHVRLDPYPKYYHYRDFRNWDLSGRR